MNPRTCLAMLVLAAVNGGVVLFQPAPAADDAPQFIPNRVFVSSAGTQSILEITLRDLPDPVTSLPPPPPGITGITGLELPVFATGILMPEDLLFGPRGQLYSTDRGTDLVTAYDADGMPLATFGFGTGLSEPSGLAFGPLGDLYVSSFGSDEIYVFDILTAPPPGNGGPPTISDPALDGPAGLAFDLNGQLYVSSYNTDEVLVFDPAGVLVDTISDPALDGPWGLAIGRDGNLYVASSDSDRVLVFDSTGDLVDTLGNDELLDEPAYLVFGANDFLFVTSTNNDQLVTFNSDGEGFILVGPGGNMQQPRGVAFAPFVMSLKLSGRMSARDQADSKAKSDGTLSVAPGSGVMMMHLEDPDPVDDPNPIVEAFGTPTMVFHGYEVFSEHESKSRVYHGAMTPDDARGAGVGTLLLELKGKLESNEYTPKSGKGYLHRAGEGGVLEAKVKAKAPKIKNK